MHLENFTLTSADWTVIIYTVNVRTTVWTNCYFFVHLVRLDRTTKWKMSEYSI